MGFFSELFEQFNSKTNDKVNDNTIYNKANGIEMQSYVREQIQPTLRNIENLHKNLLATEDLSPYEVDLTYQQANDIQNFVKYKREGKFVLANKGYLELIKIGPLSYTLLTSWVKVLLCLSLTREACIVLEFCDDIAKIRGYWSPMQRAASQLYTIKKGSVEERIELIQAVSGIDNFQPISDHD